MVLTSFQELTQIMDMSDVRGGKLDFRQHPVIIPRSLFSALHWNGKATAVHGLERVDCGLLV